MNMFKSTKLTLATFAVLVGFAAASPLYAHKKPPADTMMQGGDMMGMMNMMTQMNKMMELCNKMMEASMQGTGSNKMPMPVPQPVPEPPK
jgi:hypothetical protein